MARVGERGVAVSEKHRKAGALAKNRHVFTSDEASAAGRKGGKAAAEARRCEGCGKVKGTRKAHVCEGAS